MRPGCRRSAQLGTSLLELTVAMAMAAILAAVGLSQVDTGPAQLAAAHQEIRGSLDQAFNLARARGTNVTVALGKASGEGEHLPVQLSRKVKWGKPATIPLPPGMEKPSVAATTGEAHPVLTVTPRHTALASVWFLHDGREALCMRLSGHGQLQVLRWRRDLRIWTRL
jgi:type II secretory pathway pseudopilin PulG